LSLDWRILNVGIQLFHKEVNGILRDLYLIAGLGLWLKIFASRLVEPLSLVKAPSSLLYDLSKVSSSIWMLVFFLYLRI
jgi:hypothetical protein